MWTKEETDELFDLCERFDLRFILIADRFPSSRTVEELKDRYYSGTSLFNKILYVALCYAFSLIHALCLIVWRLHKQKCDMFIFDHIPLSVL